MSRINEETPSFIKFICKHCKVEVVARDNVKAVWGREHGKHCPRRFK